jgi:hypothetical protein
MIIETPSKAVLDGLIQAAFEAPSEDAPTVAKLTTEEFEALVERLPSWNFDFVITYTNVNERSLCMASAADRAIGFLQINIIN